MKRVKLTKKYATTYYDKEDIEIFKNELFFYLLAKQKRIDFIPKIVDFDCDKLTIRTKTVGISLEEYCDKYDCDHNNYLPKIKELYKNLKKLGYYHNDLRFKNIVINPNTHKLYLIDFEFSDREYKDKDDEKIVERIKTKKKINKTKRRSKKK